MIAISIIVPVYNKVQYLDLLYETINQQTFKNFECILIDDGSTDGSSSKCDEIVLKDCRFKVYHITNAGVSHARNVALEIANGEYITFVDADDSLHQDYLKVLYGALKHNQVDIVISSLVKVWKDSEKQELIAPPYRGVHGWADIIEHFAQVQTEIGIYGFCCAKLVSRKMIGNLRFDENIKLAEDLDFYLSLYERVNTIYFDDCGYYYYLQEADNSSMQKADHEIDYFSQLKIQIKVYTFLKNKNALTMENLEVISNRIYDYIFFSLYHCSVDKLREMCIKIRRIDTLENYQVSKHKSWQYKWIMFLYRNKYDTILVCSKHFYDSIRKLLHKMMKLHLKG